MGTLFTARIRTFLFPACIAAAYAACGTPFKAVSTTDDAGGAAGDAPDASAGESGLANAGNASGGASSEAGAPGAGGGEANAGCTTDSACSNGADQGVCVGGVCAACQEPTDDGACAAAYGKGTLCIGGSCTTAQCRADDECPSGKLCMNNQSRWKVV